MKSIGTAFALGLAWLAAGCTSTTVPRDFTVLHPRFYLEASGDMNGTVTVLPRSGVNVTVNAKPVLTEGDIINVDLAQVELGKCLMFQLTPSATRDFYRLSGSHQGRRLVLTINEAPLGARRIDGAITDGVVFIFVETPEDELPRLVENLKKSAALLQQELRRKG
jgi:hypothetical protein